MAALDTFRKPPCRHNCAQAVANQWTALYDSSDIVDQYAPYVGGRAPGGLCGALYAATQALPAHADDIAREFAAVVGATTCRQIKAMAMTPCEVCVETADRLVAKYAKK